MEFWFAATGTGRTTLVSIAPEAGSDDHIALLGLNDTTPEKILSSPSGREVTD